MNTSPLRRWSAPVGLLAVALVALVVVLLPDGKNEPEVPASLRATVAKLAEDLVAYDSLLWNFDDGEAGLERSEMRLTYAEGSTLEVAPAVFDEISDRVTLLRGGTAYEAGDVDTHFVEVDGAPVAEVEFTRGWTVDDVESSMSDSFRLTLYPLGDNHRVTSLNFRPESGWGN